MSIGETLAQARHDAGLSIADISSQTGIKLSIIDEIEHDNYTACGGDYRARETIAAIARTLGLDPGPLIDAYDTARQPAGWIAATASEPDLAAQAPEEFTRWPDPEPVMADPDTQPITMSLPPEPPPADEPADEPAGLSTTAESPDPVAPVEAVMLAGARWPARPASAGQRPFIWFALGGALLVVITLGGILLIMGTAGQPTPPALSAGRHHHGGPSGGRGAAHPTPTRPPPSPASKGSAQALAPASIAAFGPGGPGQGDSPQLARQALAGKAAAPWHSAWYTTSRFGNLQPGTGLLLNMGRKVTITSARITLGNHPGTDLALRIGNSPALARLRPAAHANGAAGVVELKTAPTRGRYVLVWFTRLPPDRAGTFQVSVYDIKVRGYR